jgi:hypothetical protein
MPAVFFINARHTHSVYSAHASVTCSCVRQFKNEPRTVSQFVNASAVLVPRHGALSHNDCLREQSRSRHCD